MSYADLEPYLTEMEQIMAISGPEGGPWDRQWPYPLPPHRCSPADELLKKAHGKLHIEVPCARASRPTMQRTRCFSNNVCSICPVDAKFNLFNGMMAPFEDPRVSVMLEADVTAVDIQAGVARGVTYTKEGVEHQVAADMVIRAAHGFQNPYLLKRSGYDNDLVGRHLHGELSFFGEIMLDGVEHFGGSSILTCYNYSHYDGDFRSERGSLFIEHHNQGRLRIEKGRWRQVIPIMGKIEETPLPENRVIVSDQNPSKPTVVMEHHSEYAMRTYRMAKSLLEKTYASLPVEDIVVHRTNDFTAHIYGTTIMGKDPATSVVDGDMLLHDVRNLMVLGSSCFPSGGHNNPTITLSALAMRSADRLTGNA